MRRLLAFSFAVWCLFGLMAGAAGGAPVEIDYELAALDLAMPVVAPVVRRGFTLREFDTKPCTGGDEQLVARYARGSREFLFIVARPRQCLGDVGDSKPSSRPLVRGRRASFYTFGRWQRLLTWRERGIEVTLVGSAKRADILAVARSVVRVPDPAWGSEPNPVALGEPYVTDGGVELAVTSIDEPGQLPAGTRPPFPGYEYVAARVAVRYVGDAGSASLLGNEFALTGASEAIYAQSSAGCPLPEPALAFPLTLPRGVVFDGHVLCVEVPVGDAVRASLVYVGPDETVYFGSA